jgi:hypothetical protein
VISVVKRALNFPEIISKAKEGVVEAVFGMGMAALKFFILIFHFSFLEF